MAGLEQLARAAAPRWADLARTAGQTVIFADFERGRLRPGPVAEVAVPRDSPPRREWPLVCDAPDHTACVTGWEPPGQDRCRDTDRIFEVLWSVDPQVVRTAARMGATLAAAAFPAMTGPLETRLSGEPGPGSADLHRASGLIERTLDDLTRAPRASLLPPNPHTPRIARTRISAVSPFRARAPRRPPCRGPRASSSTS